jgi:hypothetical protein
MEVVIGKKKTIGCPQYPGGEDAKGNFVCFLVFVNDVIFVCFLSRSLI